MTQNVDKDAAAEADLDAELDQLTATKETLEDYTLRFAPRSYRKWSTRVVGISALGGIAYLADFAIGANIGIAYGTTNALWGIAIFAVVIFVTGFPLAYYAARYNIDLDLITRGSGFGYYGSVVTNVIFATFTFIFFALEGSIMAQGLEARAGHSAAGRLCGLDVDHLPARHLRHESPFHTAGLDDSAVADPDGGAVRLPGGQPPRLDQRILRLSGRAGQRRDEPRLHPVGGRRVSVTDRPDRRADRLSAVHAAAHAGERAQLVDVDDPGRPGLGDLRCDQADRRPVPGRVPDRQRG